MELPDERTGLFFLGSCIDRLQEHVDQVAIKFYKGINPGQFYTLGIPGDKGFEHDSITLNGAVEITV